MDSFEEELKKETLSEIRENLADLSSMLDKVSREEAGTHFTNELFRIIHNMKGNSKSVGLSELSATFHLLEEKLLPIKYREQEFDEETYDMIFGSLDTLMEAVERYQANTNAYYDFGPIQHFIRTSGWGEKTSKSPQTDTNEGSQEQSDAVKQAEATPDNVRSQPTAAASINRGRAKFVSDRELRFLIIDDEEELVDVLTDFLEEDFAGEYVKAKNGLEGFHQTQIDRFDLIITDFQMPTMTGGEFVKALREKEGQNKHTPIIMISGYRPNLDPDSKLWKNVFFVDKPLKLERLCFLVKCCLNLGRNADSKAS